MQNHLPASGRPSANVQTRRALAGGPKLGPAPGADAPTAVPARRDGRRPFTARTWRRFAWAAATLAALLTALFLGAGWYYADILRDGALVPHPGVDRMDLTVVSLHDGEITLRAPEGKPPGDWTHEGTWGLAWDGGYGHVGAIRGRSGSEVTRDFTPLNGSPPPGVAARVDSVAFPLDPLAAFGMPFETVAIEGELGPMPAWYVPASSTTWAIFIHGQDGPLRQGLRILAPLHAAGLPTLIINYRNDPGAPASSDGYHRYGATEWRDVEAAGRYALDHGAEHLVLIGYSMGGGIAAAFQLNSSLAAYVSGVVLDSPMLDFSRSVDFRAERQHVPGSLTTLGKWFAGWRFDIDWDALDYLGRAGSFTAPILLFHGDNDTSVPRSTSDALAARRPDLVTYVQVAGAGHTRAWNADPAAYDDAVASFLQSVMRD